MVSAPLMLFNQRCLSSTSTSLAKASRLDPDSPTLPPTASPHRGGASTINHVLLHNDQFVGLFMTVARTKPPSPISPHFFKYRRICLG